MNSTGPHGTPRKRPAATAETTTEKTTEKTTEDKLREECARLRADNRALRRAEARRQFPPSAALYGPRPTQSFHIGEALEGQLLTGRELVVANKERPVYDPYNDRYSLEVWLRNNGIDPAELRHVSLRLAASRARGNPNIGGRLRRAERAVRGARGSLRRARTREPDSLPPHLRSTRPRIPKPPLPRRFTTDVADPP